MTEPIRTTENYLSQLKRELAGADPALIQDALSDAQEFIRNEQAALTDERGETVDDAELVGRVIESFGSPDEVAQAYRESEAQVAAALAPHLDRRSATSTTAATPAGTPGRDAWPGALGILIDPRAYSRVFYSLLSLPTGILYFTWVVTGIALSLGLSILIIGLPFALFFLATVRALSLVEGRIVETLLGTRMPRRADTTTPPGSWLDRIKYWVTDRRSWSTLFYFLLRLPLGIISFVLIVTFLSLSVGFLGGPIACRLFDMPVTIWTWEFIPPLWSFPLWWLCSGLFALIGLHLAIALGRINGSLAKAMLVRS